VYFVHECFDALAVLISASLRGTFNHLPDCCRYFVSILCRCSWNRCVLAAGSVSGGHLGCEFRSFLMLYFLHVAPVSAGCVGRLKANVSAWLGACVVISCGVVVVTSRRQVRHSSVARALAFSSLQAAQLGTAWLKAGSDLLARSRGRNAFA